MFPASPLKPWLKVLISDFNSFYLADKLEKRYTPIPFQGIASLYFFFPVTDIRSIKYIANVNFHFIYRHSGTFLQST